MRAIISLVAQTVVRDADNNAISVFEILEQITAVGFPLLVQNMVFFVLWEREEGEPGQRDAQLAIKLGEHDLFNHALELNFGDKLRLRSINRLKGLVLPAPDDLTFTIDAGAGIIASYTVSVIAAEAPAPEIEVVGGA